MILPSPAASLAFRIARLAFLELGIGEMPLLSVNQTSERAASPISAIKPISNMCENKNEATPFIQKVRHQIALLMLSADSFNPEKIASATCCGNLSGIMALTAAITVGVATRISSIIESTSLRRPSFFAAKWK